MKFCSRCGKEIFEEAVICPHCGCAVSPNYVAREVDEPSIGYAILGFFIPLVGLILYLVFKEKTPMKAKSAGLGALVGFVIGIIISFIAVILISSMYSSMLESLFDSMYY
jgi:uncharacterized membrane protein YvbJ